MRLTLDDIRVLYERYVPRVSRFHAVLDTESALWWPAHEIGHLLTAPRRSIGMPLFGMVTEGASNQEMARCMAYELAAMSISRRLLTACGRPDLFFDLEIGEFEASDYDVMHDGSRSRARNILRRRRLLRLPRTRAGLETLCQSAHQIPSGPEQPR